MADPKRRQRAYDQRRLDAGWKRIELWLGPEDQAALESWREELWRPRRFDRSDPSNRPHGSAPSAQEAIRRAIEECARRK